MCAVAVEREGRLERVDEGSAAEPQVAAKPAEPSWLERQALRFMRWDLQHPHSLYLRTQHRLAITYFRLGFGRFDADMVVTTTGRKSGLPRHVVMGVILTIDDRLYALNPFGERAHWYRNLLADPMVTVQRRGRTWTARATRVTEPGEAAMLYEQIPGSALRWLLRVEGIADDTEEFSRNIDRFHVVRFDEVDEPGPPLLPSDLMWVWPVAGLSGLVSLLARGKRRVALAGVLAAIGVGALARRRAVRSWLPKPVTGMSANGMAYARWGEGAKTLLLMPGGPGNSAPGGISLWMMLRTFRRFVEEGYTVWYVVRKQGMPKGHSIADMADDYAEFIGSELDGRVDVVLGTSYGGIIGFYLAARHPDRFGHIAIALAGYEVSERGKHIDYTFAERLSQGRPVEAATGMFQDYYPDLRIPGLARLFGEVMGRFGFRDLHPEFASDVMVEADAEVAFDARPILSEIRVPVLLIGGGADFFFPEGHLEETARLIPDCTLRVYGGKGHMQAFSDSRFCPDVIDFLERDR